MIKKDIESIVKKALQALKFPQENVVVVKSTHADFATNIALRLGKFGDYQTPLEIASILVPELKKSQLFSEVSVAPPGFINFTINQKEAAQYLQKVVNDAERYGSQNIASGKHARVEFVSANPTGPLHLGNARGGPLGDVLANVLGSQGYQVLREYYNNNIGTQVDIFGDSLIVMIKKVLGLPVEVDEKVAYEGEYLEELAKKMIETLKLTSTQDIEANAYEIKIGGIQTLFDEIIKDCRDMGIEFDQVYHESDIQEQETPSVIEELKEKGLTKEKEGALWFAPNEDFLTDKEAVIERSQGRRPTYFADDIAYHKIKFKDKPDLVLNVLGSNHHGHVPRVQAAIQALGNDVEKYKVLLYQYVRVKRGNEIVKMSKRAGNFITAREVLEEVGKDAFRFFLLLHAPNTHMDFDLELAKKSSSDNPVYYVQYAHARMNSILTKAPMVNGEIALSLLKEKEEFNLIKKVLELPDLLEEISGNFAVHQLTFYSMELAEEFHKFYEACKVISEDDALTAARLELVKATKITLANTLKLLGVSAPERM